MSLKKMFAALTGGAIAALSCAGCSVQAGAGIDVPVYTDQGLLSVDWTIDGSTDPFACTDFGAYDFELIVYDVLGRPYTTTVVPCEDFTVTVELPEGEYTADATLVDPFANAVTVTRPLDAIDVIAGDELIIDLDFQPSSFL